MLEAFFTENVYKTKLKRKITVATWHEMQLLRCSWVPTRIDIQDVLNEGLVCITSFVFFFLLLSIIQVRLHKNHNYHSSSNQKMLLRYVWVCMCNNFDIKYFERYVDRNIMLHYTRSTGYGRSNEHIRIYSFVIYFF